MGEAPVGPGGGDDLTSLHVRRAVAGNPESLDWIVARLTPLLLLQAESRLGPVLRRRYDPGDLVNDVWAAALPRLGAFEAEPGRYVRSLVGYLSTALFHRVERLLDLALRENRRDDAMQPATGCDPLADAPSPMTSIASRAVAAEKRGEVWRQIQELDAKDREVIVLRGIEQHPAAEVAAILDLTPAAVDQRYSRALKRLRAALPRSVFADLEAPAAN